MKEKEFVKKFIINNFHCSEYFFESVWKYVRSNYKKSANIEEWRQSISDLYDKTQTDKQQAVKETTAVFFEALKELVKTDEVQQFFQQFEQICEKHGAKGELKTLILSSTQEVYDIIRNKKKQEVGGETKKTNEERLEYSVTLKTRDGQKMRERPRNQQQIDDIKKEDFDIYYNTCTNELFETKQKLGNIITISKTTASILCMLMKNPSIRYSVERLREKFWPDESGTGKPDDESIQKQMRFLMESLQPKKEEMYIKTDTNLPRSISETGFGYYFDPEVYYCLIEYKRPEIKG